MLPVDEVLCASVRLLPDPVHAVDKGSGALHLELCALRDQARQRSCPCCIPTAEEVHERV